MTATIERFFDDDCLVPALKAIGQSRQVEAREGLQPHHELFYEIHLITDGTVHWWVENEAYTLGPGSIYLTKPGELHGGMQNRVQPCTLNWLQLDPSGLADATIENDLSKINHRVWNGAQELVGYVTAMLAECRNPKSDSPRIVNATLSLFLAQLLRLYDRREIQTNRPSQVVRLLDYIETEVAAARQLNVNDLCIYSNLSRSRIFQLFDEHLGQSPISYITSRRIELAKALLADTDRSITELALELGYSSSQHFATVFKRTTGMTPRAFRLTSDAVIDPWLREQGRQNRLGHADLE